ncbi:MAG TPA: metal-dependent transcriptional regulator [Desulfobacterales bacterium]|nr:metal-dependent transcriptional regulator [Desulfobacterales bacterium]
MSPALSESQEDYLEAILDIEGRKHAARAVDIGRQLGVRNSSVTGALQALAGKGLVNYEPYDLVTLTSTGRRTARRIARRHQVLESFLGDQLGVDPAEAETIACRMEHALSEDVLEKLIRFIDGGSRHD